MEQLSKKLIKYMFVTGAVTTLVLAIFTGDGWRDIGLRFFYYFLLFILVAIVLSGISGDEIEK